MTQHTKSYYIINYIIFVECVFVFSLQFLFLYLVVMVNVFDETIRTNNVLKVLKKSISQTKHIKHIN